MFRLKTLGHDKNLMLLLQIDSVIELLHQHLSIMLPLCGQLLSQAIGLLENSEMDNMEYIIGTIFYQFDDYSEVCSCAFK